MAILGPSDLPLVLKVESNPLKLLAIKELGHPVVLVELMEPQFECELQRIGDFIAEYFPLEERFAFFMTQPLQAEYPLPEDAYWIRSVSWDPATTRIDDIFGAESFLFSFGPGTLLFSRNGEISCEDLSKQINPTIKTPFGFRKIQIRWNERKQSAITIKTDKDSLTCTFNHPVKINGDYIPASDCKFGDKLESMNGKSRKIIDIQKMNIDGSWSIKSPVGCYYASSKGEEFYVVH